MRFEVRGSATPELPLRVLNLLAQHGLTPVRFLVERRGNDYNVSINAVAADEQRLEKLVEKMRSMVLVTSAEVIVSRDYS